MCSNANCMDGSFTVANILKPVKIILVDKNRIENAINSGQAVVLGVGSNQNHLQLDFFNWLLPIFPVLF